MAARDQVVRRLAATIAVNSRIAEPERSRRTAGRVPPELVEQYEHQVDPGVQLSQSERRKRANAAWRRDEALRLLEEYKASSQLHGDAS